MLLWVAKSLMAIGKGLPMTVPDVQGTLARAAFARGDWVETQQQLRMAGRSRSLVPGELELLSQASWLLGDVPASMDQSEQAFAGYLNAGETRAAAALALRLSLEWSTRGELVLGSAWTGRARRLLRDEPRSPLSGYLDYVEATFDLLVMELEGGPALAEAAATRVAALADEFSDPTLSCSALVLSGLSAIAQGRTTIGFNQLDEAMLPVVAGQVDPLWAGDIYCTVIHVSEALGDLARMRSWTDALARWAAPLSELFMYAHVTRVHQLQLIAAEGEWDVAEAELGTHSRRLRQADSWLSGAGFTLLGDVRRLRGDLSGAREAYGMAHEAGFDPQPGEADLLRAAGRSIDALSALRAAIGERGRLERARLLLPAIELAVETGERGVATAYAAELEDTATFFGTPGLRARAHQARATLAIADGRVAEALPQLEAAADIFRDQRFRYAVARVHEQLGQAYAALGDAPSATAELATARAIYARLGAVPDLDRLADGPAKEVPGHLTAREVEVLSGVAAGLSNRQVAQKLTISDKTVGRHLANIFAKLGVSSRTAAAAWAHEHGIGDRNDR